MAERKGISKRTRFEIFKRDQFTCQYCGSQPPDVILHVDHIIAVANGGQNDMENLVTSCSDCNLGKSAVPLDMVPQSLEDRAAEAEERQAQVEAYAIQLQELRDAFENQCWQVAEVLKKGASDGYSRSNFRSITMFCKRLGFPETLNAAHIADNAVPFERGRRFKYFCAVCWNRIREIEASDGELEE